PSRRRRRRPAFGCYPGPISVSASKAPGTGEPLERLWFGSTVNGSRQRPVSRRRGSRRDSGKDLSRLYRSVARLVDELVHLIVGERASRRFGGGEDAVDHLVGHRQPPAFEPED